MSDLDKIDESLGTVVFVLGAGCSSDCGAPLMSEFMATAYERNRKTHRTLQDAYDATFAFRDECRAISSTFDRLWDNIEELFTQAELHDLCDRGGDGELPRSIAKVIWDVYRQPRSRRSCGYSNFIGYLNILNEVWRIKSGPRPVIITTNYDVNLESVLLAKLGMARRYLIAYPGEFKTSELAIASESIREHATSGAPNNVVELIKLHGSVNWLPREDQVQVDVRTYAEETDTRPVILRCQNEDYPDELGKATPLIVGPSLGKIVSEPFLREQWQAAFRALRHARDIVVAGYSFPETDGFMTRLLSEGIRSNKVVHRTFVVNPSKDAAWWNRIENLFSRSYWRNKVVRLRSDFRGLAIHLGSNVTGLPPDLLTRVRHRNSNVDRFPLEEL